MLFNNYLIFLFHVFLLLDLHAFELQIATKSKDRSFLLKTRKCDRKKRLSLFAQHHDDKLSLFDLISNRLQGDFDNYDQVLRDVMNNKFPGPTGGHEHMHCTFLPIDKINFQTGEEGPEMRKVIAAYYLNGQPSQLFRLRLYTLKPETEEEVVRLKIYVLSDTIRDVIKAAINQPLEWENLIQCILEEDYRSTTIGTQQQRHHFFELKGCDVLWSTQPDPNHHSYQLDTSDHESPPPVSEACHAILENKKGSVILPSANSPGVFMVVKDELSLWENELWINDRGYNADTLQQMYGNHAEIPYKVVRVTNIVKSNSSSYDRVLVLSSSNNKETDLSWTLGDSWRTNEVYEQKMKALRLG